MEKDTCVHRREVERNSSPFFGEVDKIVVIFFFLIFSTFPIT